MTGTMLVICQALSSCHMSTDRPTRDRPTDRQTDLKTDSDTRQTDRPTDRNQKIDRPTEPTVKSTYFVPAVKHRGGEWWWGDGVGPGSKAALNSRIGNTQICPTHAVP